MDDLIGANDFPEELQKLFSETPMLLFEVYFSKISTGFRLICNRFVDFCKERMIKRLYRSM